MWKMGRLHHPEVALILVISLNGPAMAADQDCTAMGDVQEREACYAKMPEAQIAACESVRSNACRPYKEMHALSGELDRLIQDIKAAARSRYAPYAAGDVAYVDDLIKFIDASDRAWRAHRDAECRLEPLIQGMSRREVADLEEVCRMERSQGRVAELSATLDSLRQ